MPSTSTHLLVPNVPFQTGLVLGLLEKAERWSSLMGKLGNLMKTEECIPSEHLMFQQSHRDCV